MMKRQTGKHNMSHRAAPLLFGLFLIPLALGAAFSLSPDWGLLAERAALASAMLNMPEGSLLLLEQRFAGDIDESASSSSGAESSSAPSEPDMSAPAPIESSSDAAASQSPSAAHPLTPPPPAKDAPEIPAKYRGKLLQENMAGNPASLIQRGGGLLRNYTTLPDSEVETLAAGKSPITLEETDEPQVLIFHTHATESYEEYDSETFDTRATWRSTDNEKNMAAVGDVLAKTLEDAGIAVIHDTTQHDYPSYTGAYERSAKTIQGYLEKYPTIKIVLDVHRDAILRADDVIVKPVVEIDGKKAAQLMIITGSDDGTMNIPNWKQNLRFAASLQEQLEKDYPQLTRPIFFCYRKYNMNLSNGSLLLEFGSNANTLAESMYTAELVGNSLANLLKNNE